MTQSLIVPVLAECGSRFRKRGPIIIVSPRACKGWFLDGTFLSDHQPWNAETFCDGRRALTVESIVSACTVLWIIFNNEEQVWRSV